MDGVGLIACERERQVKEKGWTSEHDDQWINGELAYAAICYASFSAQGNPPNIRNLVRHNFRFSRDWPFDKSWWKPSIGDDLNGRILELIKAGALIAAEIDRLQRLERR